MVQVPTIRIRAQWIMGLLVWLIFHENPCFSREHTYGSYYLHTTHIRTCIIGTLKLSNLQVNLPTNGHTICIVLPRVVGRLIALHLIFFSTSNQLCTQVPVRVMHRSYDSYQSFSALVSEYFSTFISHMLLYPSFLQN